MKRIILLIFLFFITYSNCYAINWEEIHVKNGKISYLDLDSIQKSEKYYFYNVKFITPKEEIVVVTLQSSQNSPFCSRNRVYTIDEYTNLNGNYEHIQDNVSENLEPVFYGLVAHSAYKYVKMMDSFKNNNIDIN